jgi:hypothetical protein
LRTAQSRVPVSQTRPNEHFPPDWGVIPPQISFDSIEQIRQGTTRWLWTYTNERPNMALGGITPMQNWPWPPSSTFSYS